MRFTFSLLMLSISAFSLADDVQYQQLKQVYQDLHELRLELESTQPLAGVTGEKGAKGAQGDKGVQGLPGDRIEANDFSLFNIVFTQRETWMTEMQATTDGLTLMVQQTESMIDQWYDWSKELRGALADEN